MRLLKYFIAISLLSLPIAFAQTTISEIVLNPGDIWRQSDEWVPPGDEQQTLVLNITVVAEPIVPDATDDMQPSPDWYLTFRVVVVSLRDGRTRFTKGYTFSPRGGLLRIVDTLGSLVTIGTQHRTYFLFDTKYSSLNPRAKTIRIQQGSIRVMLVDQKSTSISKPLELSKDTTLIPVKRKGFKVD